MKCVAYLRVSGRGQVEKDGFPRQFEAVKSFCAAHGLILGRCFREEAVSGTVEGLDRPAIAEMLGELASGDCVIVENLDRWARDLIVSEVLLAEFRKRGIKVYATDQQELLDMASSELDPTRVLVRQLMGMLSQWVKSQLVLKLASARKRKREQTGRCEGYLPYGATESQARVLLLIGGMLEDSSSYRNIAKFLNDSEFPSRWGKTWTHTTVKRIWTKHKQKGK